MVFTIWLTIGLIVLVWYLHRLDATYSSIYGWEPCDDDTVFSKLADLIIGQLICKCCILWRGILVGAYSMLILIVFIHEVIL